MKKLKNIAIIMVAGIITGGCSLNKQTVIGSIDVSGVGNVTAVSL